MMFGLFSKKPDARTQQQYGKQGMQASQVFSYIYTNRACPPQDGQEKIDLTIAENRASLAFEIIEKIDEVGFASALSEDKAKMLLDMAKNDQLNAYDMPQMKADASLVISMLGIVDMIARHYYDLYPQYKPLFEMVNQLAKICPSGVQVIFGDDIPVEVRRAFPHFSSLFEQNRANF